MQLLLDEAVDGQHGARDDGLATARSLAQRLSDVGEVDDVLAAVPVLMTHVADDEFEFQIGEWRLHPWSDNQR